MSLLTLVQSFCRRTGGMTVPVAVIGAPDFQTAQLQGLLEEEGADLASRFNWEGLTYEATHTTLATEDQGALTSLMPQGFDHFVPDTAWDRTQHIPLTVLDAQEWTAGKAVVNSGPNYQIRVRGGRLISDPPPPAGNTWAWEYVSRNWVSRAAGGTGTTFSDDNDTMLLPDALLLAGLRWRWKKEKGFDYAEDFASYERLVSKAMGHNGLYRPRNMACGEEKRRPGIFVPQGNWPL